MNIRRVLFISVFILLCTVIIVFVFRGNNDVAVKKIQSGTIVAFGDSLTFGPEVGTGNSYPQQLDALLKEQGYSNFTVINQGVNGNTTSDGLARIDDIINLKPDIVIVTLGGNDFLRKLDTTNARGNLDTIVQKLQSNDITVILGGMRAVGPQLSGAYKQDFNAIYPDIAKKYNVLLIPDFLAGVRLHAQYNLPDYIHPNSDGYALIVRKNVFPVLQKILEK